MDIPIQILNGTKEVIIQISNPLDETGLQLLQNLVSVLLGFLFALVTLWLGEKHKRKNLVSGATESLLSALKEQEQLLSNRNRPTLSVCTVRNTRQVKFTYNNVTIPIGAFDSILYSGAFREFSIEEQKHISELHEEIKLANEFGWKMMEFITMGNTISELYQENMWLHGSLLEGRYDLILNMIPVLLKLLESKKHSSWLARSYVNS